MTVNNDYEPDTYAGDGVLDTFPITFIFLGVDTNIGVSIKLDATSVFTAQVLGVHYNIVASNVVFTPGNIPASGETVVIELTPKFQQGSDYVENGDLPAETLENDLDERTLESQVNKDRIERSFKVGPDVDVGATSLEVSLPLSGVEFLTLSPSGLLETTDMVGDITVLPLPVGVSNGGTGATNLSFDSVLIGNGVSPVLTQDNVKVSSGTLTVSNGNTSAGKIDFVEDSDDGTNKCTLTSPALSADATVTLPNTTTTLVGTDTSDTLTNKTITLGGTLTTNTQTVQFTTTGVTDCLDEDDLVSDSNTSLATQQSVKAYVDTEIVGLPAAGSLVLLSTAVASSSTSVDFTSNIDSTYDEYQIHFVDVTTDTAAQTLAIRTSTDGGTTFDAGASDYSYTTIRTDSGTAQVTTLNGQPATRCVLGAVLDDAAGHSTDGVFSFFNPAGTVNSKLFRGENQANSSSGQQVDLNISCGVRHSTADIDAIRILFVSPALIETGTFRLYGVKK